ncbi:unnamed protein product [Fraxinus pennsylvanica]|uniref:Uncharacterized protein n=1 Tax=Fraxinus pennsylvanica TaxID=56036 RepID=A0AAD2A3A5_9LAMI|nr:unnamed protein product [Fraxinus pennsylvanica]
MNCCSDPVQFVTRRICGLADSEMVKDSRPDIGAYNDVLNACANLGAPRIFCNCLTKCQNLDIAEQMIQAMSERKKDICRILRELNFEDWYEDGASRKLGNESEVFEKLLPNSIDPSNNEPPELPEGIAPYSRIYTTLTKGYMKVGRRGTEKIEQAGSMDKARHVLAEMARIRVPANLIIYNVTPEWLLSAIAD